MTIDATRVSHDWRIARLGDVATVVGGSTPSRSDERYWGGDIPWVVPTELTDLSGRYLTVSRESITKQGLKAAGLQMLPAGSVLLTSRATIGVTAINTIPVATNQGFQNLVATAETAPLWLYYCISAIRPELERRSAGSTFREVSRDSVRSVPILLPPLPEQRAIAAVLDGIDEAIERTEEVIAATERLRDALLHELLTRGLPGRHSEWVDVPGLGTVPACWDVAAIGRCLERIEAGSSPRCESRPARDDEWGVLKVSSVSWGVFQPTENKALLQPSDIVPRYEVRDGDLILSRANTPDLVGRAVRVRTTPPRLLLSDKTLRLVPDPARIDPEFLLSSLRLPRSRSQIIGAATGSSRSMFNVSQDSVRKMRVALPPLEEQQAIADALENVEASIERAGEERAGLQSLQASAADALLTGRVRVREAIRDRHGQA